jgi:hypothetical protein
VKTGGRAQLVASVSALFTTIFLICGLIAYTQLLPGDFVDQTDVGHHRCHSHRCVINMVNDVDNSMGIHLASISSRVLFHSLHLFLSSQKNCGNSIDILIDGVQCLLLLLNS